MTPVPSICFQDLLTIPLSFEGAFSIVAAFAELHVRLLHPVVSDYPRLIPGLLVVGAHEALRWLRLLGILVGVGLLRLWLDGRDACIPALAFGRSRPTLMLRR